MMPLSSCKCLAILSCAVGVGSYGTLMIVIWHVTCEKETVFYCVTDRFCRLGFVILHLLVGFTVEFTGNKTV